MSARSWYQWNYDDSVVWENRRLSLFPFQVRLEEGALIMSRNGIGKMRIALELEATYGCGRDALIGLHTLVLSCNQLQVTNHWARSFLSYLILYAIYVGWLDVT